MNAAIVWERLKAISLWPRGVRSRWLNVEGDRIHCLVRYAHSAVTRRGERSPHKTRRVVCVHGLGASAGTYGGLLLHLTSSRLISHELSSELWDEAWAPSAPRHGLSSSVTRVTDAPSPRSDHGPNHEERLEREHTELNQHLYSAWERILLDLAREEAIDIIGNSLGGAIALRFAARHPERVSRLILCSPAGSRLSDSDVEHIRSVFRMSEPGDGLRFLKTLYHETPWWAKLAAPSVQRALSTPKAQEIITHLRPGDGLDPSEINKLTMPILLIWGERERVLPEASLNYLVENAPPQLKLLRPVDFSHSPQQEHPHELAQLISAWIKETATRSS